MAVSTRAGTYTLEGEAAVEQRIAADLRAVCDSVEAQLGPRMSAVLLLGGYARGEGGTLDRRGDPGPYNDYDLVVVLERVRDLPAARRRLQRIAAHWEHRLGVDVDLWPISRRALRRAPPTLFWLDVSMGARRMMAGHGEIERDLPRWKPRDVPLEEASRLLANRAVGLALSNLEDRECDELRAARHIHKAVLACGDARLLAAAHYRATFVERQAELHRLSGAPAVEPHLVSAYEEATRFRTRPDEWRYPGDDARRWYGESLAEIRRWHLEWESWRCGTPADPLELARWNGRVYTRLPDVKPAGRTLAALRSRLSGAAPLRPWVGHPRERLARVAVALAYGADDERCRAAAARLLGLSRADVTDDASLRRRLLALAQRAG